MNSLSFQEYIGAKDHLHMNATRWHTLTELVKWLGSESKCVVDQTEKGIFILLNCTLFNLLDISI